ncbi:MAG TPA: FecR family protein, partial [Bacteroidales bacterium]|nr:FecR family protein [Bacteroidales bacterium]
MDNLENNNIDITSLFVSYFMGEITPAELQILENWLDTSPQNREQFNQFEATWLLSGKTVRLDKIDNQLLWGELESKIKQTNLTEDEDQKRKGRTMSILRIAASWIIFMALGSVLTIWLSRDNTVSAEQVTEITAPLGAKSFVKLPDGTSIWLNAGSKVSYDKNFNAKERKINLSGEAFFNVVTNKEKPFTVHTSDIIVRAFGTRFNVKAYPEEKTITATLEEGKID